MTPDQEVWTWATVALCFLIAVIDPAERLKRRIRSRRRARHATGRGKPGTIGPAAGAAAPSAPAVQDPVFFEVSLPAHQVRNINAQLGWRYAQTRARAEA